jgi:hypothetical protein
VVAFCLLNGINEYNAWKLISWTDVSSKDRQKISGLFSYMAKDENKMRYYSYCVHTGLLHFLDGKIRYYGKILDN